VQTKKAAAYIESDDGEDFPSLATTPPKPATRVARISKTVKYNTFFDDSSSNESD